MFLSRNVRNRAIGLAAAYAVICLGIFVTATLDARPRAEPAQATQAALDTTKAKKVEHCEIAC